MSVDLDERFPIRIKLAFGEILSDFVRTFCLSLKGVTEDMPFEDEYLMFRIFEKWFAVVPLDDEELKISVKCDPEEAI